VVLVRSDPRDVPRIIALSKATYRKMIQNLWWAAGYNIVAIPLAAGVLSIRVSWSGLASVSSTPPRTSEAPRPDPRRVSEVSIPPNRSRSTF
jgi:cation transport ATPase